MVNEEQRTLEKNLHSASRHIVTLKKIRFTEDILERLAKALFISVCVHICLSRLGVYWVLRLLGLRSMPQYAMKISRATSRHLPIISLHNILTLYGMPFVEFLYYSLSQAGTFGHEKLDAWTTAAMGYLFFPILLL
ncbi:hypothetical protein XU18_0982 [Perkinsela sp. CCAP 1560/4]|nr:hypothetical protein XU18_0982 [Perkinsela sp. CCAP 1560/4]|eukprot:KNH08413.1 hypothetical protein XU18_0982 [Perkinsela sp. CCAP 1560/4]